MRSGGPAPTRRRNLLLGPARARYDEKFTSGITPVTWRDYIVADGQIVAVRSKTGSNVSWA